MRYQGSKRRITKNIVPIIQNFLDKEHYIYFEPFSGGCNVLKHIIANKKIGADYNEYAISIWQELKNGTLIIPENITKEQYLDVKQSYLNKDNKYSKGTIGMTGFLASYGGRLWNGYANFNPKRNENHVKEALNGLRKDWEYFKCKENTTFIHSDYSKLNIPENSSLIYCDPPYQGTLSYKESGEGFDSNKFWDWCREQENKNNIVLISEYNAPEDFVCIWQKEIPCGMNSEEGKIQSKRVEKLFIHKNRYNSLSLT